MRIVVSGGAGAMAWPSEIYLLEQPDVAEIVVADMSEAIVGKRIEQLGGKRVENTITEYATERLTLEMQKKGIFSSYRTGLYAAIATLMIGRGQVKRRGHCTPRNASLPGSSSRRQQRRVLGLM